MECAAARRTPLVPQRMKRGLEGREEGDTRWPVVVHKQGVVFEMGRVVFPTGMLFPVQDEGGGGWGAGALGQ